MNMFKRGDMIKIASQPQLGPVRVKYHSGPYVHYEHPSYNHANDYSDRCTFVSSETIINFLKAGKLIDAIKEYRAITGMGLKESKDACESLRDAFPKGRNSRTFWPPLYDTSGQTLGDILSTVLAKKPKFKVGDKVSSNWSMTTVYTVNEVLRGDGHFRVEEYPQTGYFDPEYFTLVSSSIPAIVIRMDIGKGYRPNDKPRVHNNLAEATKEAERLAMANPGVKFDTFTLATSSTATAPVAGTVTTVSL